MHEAGIELAIHVQLPELDPVLPVEVGVAAEHLLVHVLDLGVEAGWEAGGLAAPVVVRVGGCDFWGWRERGGGGEVLGGEEFRVLDFAVDPGLDVFDVDGGREVDGVAVDVDPGVGGSEGIISQALVVDGAQSDDLRACCHGWAGLLVACWLSGRTVALLHDLEHATQDAVLLHDCKSKLARAVI